MGMGQGHMAIVKLRGLNEALKLNLTHENTTLCIDAVHIVFQIKCAGHSTDTAKPVFQCQVFNGKYRNCKSDFSHFLFILLPLLRLHGLCNFFYPLVHSLFIFSFFFSELLLIP